MEAFPALAGMNRGGRKRLSILTRVTHAREDEPAGKYLGKVDQGWPSGVGFWSELLCFSWVNG